MNNNPKYFDCQDILNINFPKFKNCNIISLFQKEVYKMDVKAKIDELFSKVKNDPEFLKKFQKAPVKTVEETLGVDLPDEQINKIVEGVKAKITVDKVGNILGEIIGKK